MIDESARDQIGALIFLLRPKNGGKYCVGRRMKFRSCNSEPCSRQKKDFREEQCTGFDGKQFNINGLPPDVRWVPKYSGSENHPLPNTALPFPVALLRPLQRGIRQFGYRP